MPNHPKGKAASYFECPKCQSTEWQIVCTGAGELDKLRCVSCGTLYQHQPDPPTPHKAYDRAMKGLP